MTNESKIYLRRLHLLDKEGRVYSLDSIPEGVRSVLWRIVLHVIHIIKTDIDIQRVLLENLLTHIGFNETCTIIEGIELALRQGLLVFCMEDDHNDHNDHDDDYDDYDDYDRLTMVRGAIVDPDKYTSLKRNPDLPPLLKIRLAARTAGALRIPILLLELLRQVPSDFPVVPNWDDPTQDQNQTYITMMYLLVLPQILDVAETLLHDVCIVRGNEALPCSARLQLSRGDDDTTWLTNVRRLDGSSPEVAIGWEVKDQLLLRPLSPSDCWALRHCAALRSLRFFGAPRRPPRAGTENMILHSFREVYDEQTGTPECWKQAANYIKNLPGHLGPSLLRPKTAQLILDAFEGRGEHRRLDELPFMYWSDY
ncbi:hypothetical protein F4778DRAFT_756940 [Xylariomycetidae sp. FL2044]|nr:hypothetical protein F4778DRAFT_756940 [Xylariomycetidae sp. FL2044]